MKAVLPHRRATHIPTAGDATAGCKKEGPRASARQKSIKLAFKGGITNGNQLGRLETKNISIEMFV